MGRMIGTVSMGIRAPIIRAGDDLVQIVTNCILDAMKEDGLAPRNRDIVAITESIVARVQGNYVSVDDIAADIRAKFGCDTIGVIHPILSRNRFSTCLRGIAKGCKKIVMMLSYPSDEVGNNLVSPEKLDDLDVNPYTDVLDLKKYRELFGYEKHPFTGMDYVQYYEELITSCGAEVKFVFANDPKAILYYTKNVLNCDIHTRERTKKALKKAGAEIVYSMSDIMSAPIGDSGYNAKYGLLGSNKSTDDTIKLFPRDCQDLVEAIQNSLMQATGKHIEVMVYGDGAFKDPVGKIWELADPVVSPAYTAGLEGTPHELKLKYLADNDFAGLSGQALQDAISEKIKTKGEKVEGQMGTTPRRLTDLIGSLCDLTSGSGDKGTPIVYIQGYFDNYTTN